MNSSIRRDGLSAREVWTQRDQVTGEQLPIVDRQIALSQRLSRQQNHLPSARSKARVQVYTPPHNIRVGDLVYVNSDKSKLKARARYLVVSINDDLSCQLRKFTSSQYRSKAYTVPLHDCYLVSPTHFAQTPPGPIRGLDEANPSHSDDDLAFPPSVQDLPPNGTDDPPSQDPVNIPPEVSPSAGPLCTNSAPDPKTSSPVQPLSSPTLRRSTRTRSRPV